MAHTTKSPLREEKNMCFEAVMATTGTGRSKHEMCILEGIECVVNGEGGE
jgi:hypothetical protein